jgi:hypothetical protein
MKLKLFFLLVSVIFFGCEKTSNLSILHRIDSSMEEFGNKIFELVRNDKYKTISDLMLELKEYKELLSLSTLNEQDKNRLNNECENTLKRDIELLKLSYDRLKKDVENSGIVWAKAELDYIDFKHTRENKIEKADLILNFKYKGVNYIIEIFNCYYLKDNWFMGNEIRFRTN